MPDCFRSFSCHLQSGVTIAQRCSVTASLIWYENHNALIANRYSVIEA